MKQRTDAAKTPDSQAKRSGKKPAQTGRVTTPKQRTTGRYTPPIPTEVKRSPRWYPYMILILLFLGVICIILNYIGALPHSPSNWYTLGSLIAIVVAALSATNYR